jgi:hypothetical protein
MTRHFPPGPVAACSARSILAVGLALLLPATVLAQAAWEYSPYQVRVWIAAPPMPQFPPALHADLSAKIVARADVAFGAVVSMRCEDAPPALANGLLDNLEVPFDRLKAVAPDVSNADKLIVVRLTRGDAGWKAAARELDCRTWQWSPITERAAGSTDELPLAAWDALAASFTPIARIEAVEGAEVKARLRAGGLIINPASPAMAEKGMVLRPIVRRNDRTGQPAAKGGIQAIPWTLLSIESREDALLSCRLHSGYRAAIPSRGGARTERLALLVRPQFEITTLALKSRSAQPRPLAGYEVFAKGADGGESPLLGTTDWRGRIELPQGDGSLQVLLVRSGRQLLARLPLVPGQAELLEAPLSDDDGRLQTEGAVAAMHSRALDLAARREIVAARFRAKLKERKFDEAQTLLDEFRKLDSRTDLSRSLDEQQQQVQASDRLTQQRIDKLLGEARTLLTVKALSDDMINTLAAELARARSAPQTASTKK